MQPPEAAARGPLQLLDSLDAAAADSMNGPGFSSLGVPSYSSSSSSGTGGAVVALPPGFLAEYGVKQGQEALQQAIVPVGERG